MHCLRHGQFVLLVVLTLAAPPVVAQGVPQQMNFSGSLLDDGQPVSGDREVIFRLYSAATGGVALWQEIHHEVSFQEGFFSVRLGEHAPIDYALLFTGEQRYLEIEIEGTVLTPRLDALSVAYAFRAGVCEEARTISGLTVSELQERVSGSCGTGNYVTAVNEDGTVVCAPDQDSQYTAGEGIRLSLGEFSLDPTGCSEGDVYKYSSGAWTCLPDDVLSDTDVLDIVQTNGYLTQTDADARYVQQGTNGTISGDLTVTGSVNANGGITAGGDLNLSGNRLTNIGNFWWGRLALSSGEWSNSTGSSGTLTMPAAGAEACDAAFNVCVNNYGTGQYRIIFAIPNSYNAQWWSGLNPMAGMCWGVTTGDNECMAHESFGRGVVAAGSDGNNHCDTGGNITTCAYVDVISDNLSHDIFGALCFLP